MFTTHLLNGMIFEVAKLLENKSWQKVSTKSKQKQLKTKLFLQNLNNETNNQTLIQPKTNGGGMEKAPIIFVIVSYSHRIPERFPKFWRFPYPSGGCEFWLKQKNTYSPNGGFNGDESHGIESVKNHQQPSLTSTFKGQPSKKARNSKPKQAGHLGSRHTYTPWSLTWFSPKNTPCKGDSSWKHSFSGSIRQTLGCNYILVVQLGHVYIFVREIFHLR